MTRRAATRHTEVLEDEDVRALLAAVGRMVRVARRDLRELGKLVDLHRDDVHITDRHRNALLVVFAHEPLTVGELARHLDVATTTASLVATELERAGALYRERDPDDRRRVVLRLEPRLARFIVERRVTPLRRMLDALDASERAALIKALGLFADEIERNR